jgi:hypothetical protein
MKYSTRNTVRTVASVDLPETLPPSVTRPRAHVAAVLAQSLLEVGEDGRAALAWSWALTGAQPSPVTLSMPPGEPPSNEDILAEADADPEGSTAPSGVPSNYCDQLGEARRVLAWLTGASDEVPLDDEHRGRFIGARDDYARTDDDIRQIRDRAVVRLADSDPPGLMYSATGAGPGRWEPSRMDVAWCRGVRDLLDWVLGDRRASPLTSREMGLPAAYDLSQEEIAADEMIALGHRAAVSERRTADPPPQYCEAIQAVISWLCGETVQAPIDPVGQSPYHPLAVQQSARHSNGS